MGSGAGRGICNVEELMVEGLKLVETVLALSKLIIGFDFSMIYISFNFFLAVWKSDHMLDPFNYAF